MTLKEVIDQLKDLQMHCKEFADGDEEDSIWKDDVQALDIAIKSVEKHTSKEPISEDAYYYTKFLCPICKGRVGDDEDGDIAGYNYCPNCGQKIDWGI